jgi:hypothetical protein
MSPSRFRLRLALPVVIVAIAKNVVVQGLPDRAAVKNKAMTGKFSRHPPTFSSHVERGFAAEAIS